MFRSLFRRLARSTPVTRSNPRRGSVRPQLEALEERALLTATIRTVVAVGLPADGVTKFNSLAAALHASGYQSGDIIQIEPGSSPGNVVNADLTAPGVTNLTIEGDPAVPLSTIPTFTVSDSTLIGYSESGITFAHVNIGLVNSGALDFFVATQATITASTVTDYSSSAPQAISIDGPSSTLANSTIVNYANLSASADALVYVQPYSAGPNTNYITGNTFEAIGPTYNILQYNNGISGTLTVNDQVANNTFIGNTGQSLSFPTMFSLTGSGTGQISGMTVSDNTFTDSDSDETAILLNFQSSGTQVLRNTINLTGASSYGIRVEAGSSSGVLFTGATIDNNQISTGGATNGGQGMAFDAGSSLNIFHVQVQGNDFHNNQIGVEFLSNSSGSVEDVDLGGGNQGSIGGNDFRSFTAAATSSAGAIVVVGSGAPFSLAIPAQRNIFATGGNPQTVVGDFVSNSNVSVDTSSNLTGNAAFVQTVYQDLFKRTGDTTSAADAGSWVNGLNGGTMTQASVVHGISYSAEALDFQVNALYLRLLGRTSDSGGLTADVNYLVGGGTMEQIISNIATSPEFNSKAGANPNYVEALFVDVLGRTAGPGDVSGWAGQLGTIGETGVVNGILTSTEFRYDVAAQLYGAAPAPAASVASLLPLALHRPSQPPSSQVTGWANQGLAILTIENDFMSTSEFFMNG
jgi:hypothetical protein